MRCWWFLFHEWSKWEPMAENFLQQRQCVKCGRIKVIST